MEVEALAKIFPWTLKLQLKEWKKYITINKANGLYHSDTVKASRHYNSALYIANRTEDNNNRILLHQTLEEVSYMLKDESLAVAHKNKAIEIERVIKGLPPDFSDYNFSFDLRQHKNSNNDNNSN